MCGHNRLLVLNKLYWKRIKSNLIENQFQECKNIMQNIVILMCTNINREQNEARIPILMVLLHLQEPELRQMKEQARYQDVSRRNVLISFVLQRTYISSPNLKLLEVRTICNIFQRIIFLQDNESWQALRNLDYCLDQCKFFSHVGYNLHISLSEVLRDFSKSYINFNFIVIVL
ncbi:Hypothetical_protein [Hexamita inflata]|uniref:Hypothetical_protein n=1 Tax=Hexamita inflata TaxID=28002 RepID=A0AA86UXZ7_9EUKA|nr:Hypothetical protein HINF_LOCUS64110 [Hexamita inflata]